MDDATLARACADAMWAEDATSRGLGIQLYLGRARRGACSPWR